MQQESALRRHAIVISLSGLHEPWREIAHLGTKMVLPRSPYPHPASTECFYFIAKGKVCLTYTGSNGQDHVVLFFGNGCIFNETGVLTSDESHLACFRVLETAEVIRFPGHLVHDEGFIRRYPHLLHNMTVGTAVKFSSLYSSVYTIKHGTPLARLARFLRQLARCHNEAKHFPLDMTQLELASVLDMHRVSLFRCLQELKQRGVLLDFSRKAIVISSLEALDAVVNEEETPNWG